MKIRQIFGAILATLAFFWIVGTAGALEWDNITMLQAVVQSLLGLVVGAAGIKMAES